MSQIYPSKSFTTSASENSFLTDDELVKQVNDTKQQIAILRLENEILEKTILRCEPALMNGIQQALEYAMKLSTASPTLASISKSFSSKFDSITSPSRLLTSPSRISKRIESSAKIGGTVITGLGPKINVIERTELVTCETEDLERDLEKFISNSEKKHALLEAKLEEIAIRTKETDESLKRFDQQVIVAGWDNIAQRIPAEIWIRYLTEWTKRVDIEDEKMRLYTNTLITQYNKLKEAIKTKSELKENLKPVDFENIEIEISENLKGIEKKLHHLLKLKQLMGDANRSLNRHRKAIIKQNEYLSRIINKTKTKKESVVGIDKEKEKIVNQIEVLTKKLDIVKKKRLAYVVPNIMDYVNTKVELTDLKKRIKILENKLHTKQTDLISLKKKLKLTKNDKSKLI